MTCTFLNVRILLPEKFSLTIVTNSSVYHNVLSKLQKTIRIGILYISYTFSSFSFCFGNFIHYILTRVNVQLKLLNKYNKNSNTIP